MSQQPPALELPPSLLERQAPLAPRTTLGLGGPAAFLLRAQHVDHVIAAVASAASQGLPLFVLGGGSNVVVSDDGFDGLVVKVETRGVTVLGSVAPEGALEVQVAAGEPWDDFVAHATGQGWAGLECLSGIPGSVGATPIQNVGAYGQEVSETIARIEVLDRKTLQRRWLQTPDLNFAYRDSWLRRNPEAFVVLNVVFRLRPGGGPSVRYAELARALEGEPAPDLARVRQMVMGLRRKKSMVLDAADPNTRSAGSFFTNPIVDAQSFERVVQVATTAGLATNADEVPHWPVGEAGQVKLSAAWLIERSGFARGHREGPVGLSSAHALALVHHGGGAAQQLIALARAVQSAVHRKFGVRLSVEPVLVGLSL